MADRISLRYDSKAKWELSNPVLLRGEVGYEEGENNPHAFVQYKVGDGVRKWKDLPYSGLPCLNQLGDNELTSISQAAVTKEIQKLVQKRTILNVSLETLNYAFASKNEARSAVPLDKRARTQMLIYRLSTGVIVSEQYNGENLTGWLEERFWVDEKNNIFASDPIVINPTVNFTPGQILTLMAIKDVRIVGAKPEQKFAIQTLVATIGNSYLRITELKTGGNVENSIVFSRANTIEWGTYNANGITFMVLLDWTGLDGTVLSGSASNNMVLNPRVIAYEPIQEVVLANTSYLSAGKAISSTGAVVNNANYYATEVPVNIFGADKIHYIGRIGAATKIVFYASDNSVLYYYPEATGVAVADEWINTPSGCAYVKASCANDFINAFKLSILREPSKNTDYSIEEMMLSESYSLDGTMTYDSEGNVLSSRVVWANGSIGVFTYTDYATENKAYRGYNVTNLNAVLKLVQPPVTFGENGEIIESKALTIIKL